MKDLSIIIPAFNESSRLPFSFEKLTKELQLITESTLLKIEVIIVNDGSEDDTKTTILGLIEKYKEIGIEVKLIDLNKNSGKALALKSGFNNCSGQFVICLDADLPVELDLIRSSLELLSFEDYDVVIGNRRAANTKVIGYRSNARKLESKLLNLIIQRFLINGFPDTQCGFKAYKRNALRLIIDKSRVNHYIFDVEFIVIALELGYKVYQAPVKFAYVDREVTRIKRSFFKAFSYILLIKLYQVKGWYRS